LRHIAEMRAAFPGFVHWIGSNSSVTWKGPLQPNPCSSNYLIQVVYRLRGFPKVFVLKPALPAGAPHRWPDGSLCLFWDKEWRWKDTEAISETIMVWAALWLEYFEVWKELEVWLGPSSHDPFPEGEDDD
jgi:hypothetical protein